MIRGRFARDDFGIGINRVEDLAVLRLARVKQIEASWLDCGFRSSEPGFPYSDLGSRPRSE